MRFCEQRTVPIDPTNEISMNFFVFIFKLRNTRFLYISCSLIYSNLVILLDRVYLYIPSGTGSSVVLLGLEETGVGVSAVKYVNYVNMLIKLLKLINLYFSITEIMSLPVVSTSSHGHMQSVIINDL